MPADPIQTRPSGSPRFRPPPPDPKRQVGGGAYPTAAVSHVVPKRGDNLFLWTVFLLGLVLLGMCSWVGTQYVFGNPEKPVSYRLLTKLKKLTPPQRFSVSAAPTGEFITAEKLFARVAAMSPGEFREFDKALLRAYLRNYPSATKQAVPYLAGRFNIMDSYVLGPNDLFPSGVAALAVSTDFPKVLVEHIYSAPPGTAPLIKRNLATGTDIDLRRTFDLSAAIQATKLPDGRLLMTVVPLNYGSYGFKGTSSGFSLEPPGLLNLAAGLPVLKDARREEASQAYVAYRQRSGIGPLFTRKKKSSVPSSPGAGNTSAVTGIDAPPPPPPAPGSTPAPTPTPAVAVATPAATVPASGKAGASPASPLPGGKKPPGATVAAASASPTPALAKATGTPASPALAAATPPDTRIAKAQPVTPPPSAALPAATPLVLKSAPTSTAGAGGSSLQPFLPPGGGVAATTTNPGGSSGGAGGREWPTYAAGKQPTGRQLRVTDLASMGEQPAAATEPLYLHGDFVVSATGVNPETGDRQAVMRPREAALFGRTRVIVQYPKRRTLPTDGTELNRDPAHAFQIMDVRRTADGQVNVYVREVMAE